MIINIELDHIEANPWQTRSGPVDREYIEELANDIEDKRSSIPETMGLLQVPIGRLIDDTGKPLRPINAEQGQKMGMKVQLAFGHNRHAAFVWLNSQSGDDAWTHMPISLQYLDNQQMADYAWAENEKRRDVTPMERAQAIQKRMDDFGWTQTEAGKHLGLSQSRIAHILRLLRLPDDLKEPIGRGEISERAALEVLPLTELPEDTLESGRNTYFPSPEQIIERVKSGDSSESVRQTVDYFFDRTTANLEDARWPLDHEFKLLHLVEEEGFTHDQCSTCPDRIKRGQETRCPHAGCWEAKAEIWKNTRLEEASQASGIPIKDKEIYDWGEYQTFYTHEGHVIGDDGIFSQGCENLRLVYDVQNLEETHVTLADRGYPDIEIICLHGGDGCKCLKQRQAKALKEKEIDPEVQTAKEHERKQIQKVKDLFRQAAEDLADLLISNEYEGWLTVWKNLSVSHQEGEDWEQATVIRRIARYIVEGSYYGLKDDPDRARAYIEKVFKRGNLHWPFMGEEAADEIDTDPVEDILRRWERIQGWLEGLKEQPPTLEQVRGNLDNLRKLKDEVGEIDDEDRAPLDPLYEHDQLDEAISRLDDLEWLMTSDMWSTSGFEEHLGWLLTVPADDLNFKSHVESAPAHVLQYAYILTHGLDGHGMRAGRLRTQLNALDKQMEMDISIAGRPV